MLKQWRGTIDLKKVALNRLVSGTVLRRYLASKLEKVMRVLADLVPTSMLIFNSKPFSISLLCSQFGVQLHLLFVILSFLSISHTHKHPRLKKDFYK